MHKRDCWFPRSKKYHLFALCLLHEDLSVQIKKDAISIHRIALQMLEVDLCLPG